LAVAAPKAADLEVTAAALLVPGRLAMACDRLLVAFCFAMLCASPLILTTGLGAAGLGGSFGIGIVGGTGDDKLEEPA